MITTCAAFLIFVLFFAGGQFETHPIAAFVLGGLCACALGGMFAHLEAALVPQRHMRPTDDQPMTYMSLAICYPDKFSAPLYFRENGQFKPVKSSFLCRLDGVQAIVLEQEVINEQASQDQGYSPL